MNRIYNHKGENNPMFGNKQSEKTKEKIRLSHKKSGHKPPDQTGFKHSKHSKEKIGLASKGNQYAKGNKFSIETCLLLSKQRTGKKKSLAMRIKLRATLLELFKDPTNCPNWQGGLSFEPYSKEWTESLKAEVRTKYNNICQICFKIIKGETPSVHHIDYDKKNCSLGNLTILHNNCHMRTNFNRTHWLNHFKHA